MSTEVFHYDAFSDKPGMGNPAGIVLDTKNLSEERMLAIAAAVGFNETAFIMPSDQADLCLRFFTPGHEMDLCGHAAVASLCMMKERGFLGAGELKLETRAGVLPVSIAEDGGLTTIGMQQAEYREERFTGSLENLSDSIGLSKNDLDLRFPVVFGNTGIWTLLLPVRCLAKFRMMKPDNARFPEILTQKPRSSVHPFCLETIHPEADMHGRHFSSPFSGTVEDPVTGTASGVMGAYYWKYIRIPRENKRAILVEQGQEIGKDGVVKVELPTKQRNTVRIFGTAVFVKSFGIEA